MFTRTFVLFLLFFLYTFIIIFVIMSEKGRKCLERGCCVVWLFAVDTNTNNFGTSKKGVKSMAIPTNIKTLLSGDVVEWARIEFKGVPTDKIDSYQKNILAKCKLIRPAYMPIAEVVDYENKKIIVLWCPGGDSRPYSSPKTMAKDNKERIHYIRKMSNTVEPSDDEENRNCKFSRPGSFCYIGRTKDISCIQPAV